MFETRYNRRTQNGKITRAVVVVLVAVTAMVSMPLAYAQNTTTDQQQGQAIRETQNIVSQSVEGADDVPDGYTIRWSTIGEIEGNKGIGALLAECFPGEIPLTPLYDFEENIGITEQYVIGIEDHLALLLVVQNYGNEKQALSMGVACWNPEGEDDDGGDSINIDNSIIITNIVKNIVKNVNKNITIIGNGTGGNGSVVIPPPPSGGNNGTDTNNNTTDIGTGGGNNNATDTVTPPTDDTTGGAGENTTDTGGTTSSPAIVEDATGTTTPPPPPTEEETTGTPPADTGSTPASEPEETTSEEESESESESETDEESTGQPQESQSSSSDSSSGGESGGGESGTTT